MNDLARTGSQILNLSAEVDAGRLRLESAAAELCVQACDDYVTGLRGLVDSTAGMVRKEAFGTLLSGQMLAEKFFNLAHGDSGSFRSVLLQHIDVVEDMKDVFRKAGAAYRTAEESNQQAINSAGADA